MTTVSNHHLYNCSKESCSTCKDIEYNIWRDDFYILIRPSELYMAIDNTLQSLQGNYLNRKVATVEAKAATYEIIQYFGNTEGKKQEENSIARNQKHTQETYTQTDAPLQREIATSTEYLAPLQKTRNKATLTDRNDTMTEETQTPVYKKKNKSLQTPTPATTEQQTETTIQCTTMDTQTVIQTEDKEQQIDQTPTTDANEEKLTVIATTQTEKKKRRKRPPKWIRDQQKAEALYRANLHQQQHHIIYNDLQSTRRQLPPTDFLWWLYDTFNQNYELQWQFGNRQYGHRWRNRNNQTTPHGCRRY